MTEKKELTLQEKANVFKVEYEKLCAEHGFIHQSIPFPTDTAVIHALLQIVILQKDANA